MSNKDKDKDRDRDIDEKERERVNIFDEELVSMLTRLNPEVASDVVLSAIDASK